MKKLFAFCAGLLAVLNQTAVTALAAEPEAAGAAARRRYGFVFHLQDSCSALRSFRL